MLPHEETARALECIIAQLTGDEDAWERAWPGPGADVTLMVGALMGLVVSAWEHRGLDPLAHARRLLALERSVSN